MDGQTSNETAKTPPAARSEVWCVHCGAEAEPSWTFCGGCGQPIHPDARGPAPEDTTANTISIFVEPVPVVAGAPESLASPAEPSRNEHHAQAKRRPGKRSPLRVLAYSLAGLLLLGLAGTAGYIQQQTQGELDATRKTLTETRNQLQDTNGKFTETHGELSTTQAELSSAVDDLQVTKSRLADKLRELSGLRGSLDGAQERLDLQANQIGTLQSCLNGVTDAMSYAAYSDYGAAIAALEAVEVSCNKAYQLF